MLDVATLSDEDLAQKLRDFMIVGAITDTTRKVYQRKLHRLLQEGDQARSVQSIVQPSEDLHYEDYSEHDDDEDEEETELKMPVKMPVNVPKSTGSAYSPAMTSPFSDQPIRRRELRTETAEIFRHTTVHKRDEVDSRFTVKPKEQMHKAAEAKQQVQSKPKKSGGLSIWLQLLIVIIVGVIIFLIIQNMEPASTNPIGHIDSNV